MSKKDTGTAFFFQDFALTLYLAEGIDSIPFITYELWKQQISNYQVWFHYLCPIGEKKTFGCQGNRTQHRSIHNINVSRATLHR